MQQRSEIRLPSNMGEGGILEKFNKVLVIGLGQLGLPVAKYIHQRGFETYCYDVNPAAMELANSFGIKKSQDFSDIDVFVICISTHRQDDIYSPDTTGLSVIARKIFNEAKNDALVSIESTVSQGTSRKVFEIMNHRLHVVHVPHRWYSQEEDVHGVNQLRVIGGISKCCLNLGLEFYGTNTRIVSSADTHVPKNLSIPLHPVSEIEIAELTKIIENSYRYVQIAFAEDLYLFCQDKNVNFDELRNALNTKWNVNVLEARDGIGGHCLPKDAKMFLQSSDATKSKIVASAIDVDQDYRRCKERENIVLQSKLPEKKLK